MPQQLHADPNAVVSHNIEQKLPDITLKRRGHCRNPRTNLLSYWSAARIASARPLSFQDSSLRPSDAINANLHRHQAERGPIQVRESFLPDSFNSSRIRLMMQTSFDSSRVAQPSRFPYSAVGKLLMTINGVDLFGSAWVIGETAIVTAGHCVFADRSHSWTENVAFAPQFDRSAIHGVWNATSIHTLQGWVDQGSSARAFDIGGVILERPIASTTGLIGWMANALNNQERYQAVGYPGLWVSNQYDYDGSKMWRCNGRYINGSNLVQMENNMTEGSSGGPWLVVRNGQVYSNGINSYRLSTSPNTLFSPYFGAGFVNLVNRITSPAATS